jgi:hypothetical protein
MELALFFHDLLIGSYVMTFSAKYARTFFPGKQKSKWSIYWENFWWTIKYNEINHDYYLYGFNLRDKCTSNYLAYSEFRVLRNILNIRIHENRKNTKYCFNYLALVRDKFVFYQYCQSLNIPHPKTFGITSGDKVWWIGFGRTDYEDIHSIEQVPDFDAFCKEVAGGGGRKAFTLQNRNGKTIVNGRDVSLPELSDSFRNEVFVIQERMIQHSEISRIYPNSINTIRLETLLKENGEIIVFDALLRLGAGGRNVDNWGLGGIVVGIDETTGRLKDWGFYKPGFGGIVHEKHPETGEAFAGCPIPFFDEAVALSTKLHRSLYGLPSMGWDIAITPTGPVFLEAGEDWEIGLVQGHHGGLRNEFYEFHGRALDVPLRHVR